MTLIGVGNDFINFKINFNRPIWRSTFSQYKLGYLCSTDLCYFLTLKIKLGSSVS